MTNLKKEADGKMLPVVHFLGSMQEKYNEVSGDVGRRGSIYRSSRVETESPVDTGLGNTSQVPHSSSSSSSSLITIGDSRLRPRFLGMDLLTLPA